MNGNGIFNIFDLHALFVNSYHPVGYSTLILKGYSLFNSKNILKFSVTYVIEMVDREPLKQKYGTAHVLIV